MFAKLFNGLRQAPPHSTKLNWLVAFFATWFVVGVFTDGWAHNHLDSALETFFTPWHALFYSGFTLLALAIGITWLKNVRGGFRWDHALPAGYNAAAIGIIIFFIGGAADLIWHAVFGIEADIEALLSPSHLLLAIGGALAVSGPWRAQLATKNPDVNFLTELPLIVSVTCTMAIVMFMTQYIHPVNHPWLAVSKQTADPFFGHALGVGNYLVQVTVLMGFLLSAQARRRLPTGSFILIIGLTALGISFMKDTFYLAAAAFIGAIVIEIISLLLLNTKITPARWQAWAVLTPAIFAASLVAATLLKEPTWWSIHLWSGVVAISAIIGWMMSYVVDAKISQ